MLLTLSYHQWFMNLFSSSEVVILITLFFIKIKLFFVCFCFSDPSCPQFAQFWRPVCLIDPSVWHKWLHTYRFCLILQHDLPLPRYLHTASPNGRYQGVQSRHASATLFNFLKDWTSFVLIENHTYLKLVSSG